MEAITTHEVAPIAGDEAGITVSGIMRAVTEYYVTDQETITDPRQRDSAFVDVLALFCTLADTYTDLTKQDIADVIHRDSGAVCKLTERIQKRADDPRMQQHLDELTRASRGEPLNTTLDTWSARVSYHYDLPIEEIKSSKLARAKEARGVLAYFFAHHTILTKGAIGRRTGCGRSTMGAAIQAIADRRSADPHFAERLSSLEQGKQSERCTAEYILQCASDSLVAERGSEVAAYFGLSADCVHEAMQKITVQQLADPIFEQKLLDIQAGAFRIGPPGEEMRSDQVVLSLLQRRTRSKSIQDFHPTAIDLYLSEIAQVPLLKGIEEEWCLARAIEKGRWAQIIMEVGICTPELVRVAGLGARAKDELIRANLRLVVHIAKRYKLSRNQEFSDLIQEGNLGLEHAVDKYDWREEFRFSTYATFWVRRSIEESMRKARGVIIPQRKELRARQARKEAGGDETKLTPEQLEWRRLTSPASLQSKVGSDDSAELGDLIPDEQHPGPEQIVVMADEYQSLHDALGRLPNPDYAAALKLYYGLVDGREYTYEEIGQRLGKSKYTIREHVQRAKKALRAELGEAFGSE